MLRSIRYILLLSLFILLTGCGGQDPTTEATTSEIEPTETALLSEIILNLAGDDVMSISYSPDGAWLVTGAWGGSDDIEVYDEIRIWDANSGEELQAFSEGGNAVLSVAFSPDGRWVAAGLVAQSDNVILWDVAAEKTVAVLDGHNSWVRSVAFSPDGRTLASGSDDTLGTPMVNLWDVETLDLITTLEGVSSDVSSVAFSHDGSFLAAGLEDGTIPIWDLSSFTVVKTLDGGAGDIMSLAFSPDGKTLAAGPLFVTVQLWDVPSENVLWTQEHGTYARGIVFSADGGLLAAGLEDGRVLVWNSMAKELIATLEGHQWRVNSVAFSPVGDRLASGSDDGTVILWPLHDLKDRALVLTEAASSATAATPARAASTPLAAGTTTPADLSGVRIDAFGLPMVLIPGDVYQIGGDPAQSLENCLQYRDDCQLAWFEDESPFHQVRLDDYMIDQFEVTNARYAECVDAGVCDPPEVIRSATRDRYYGNPAYDDYPVIYASWEDANTYCTWRGGRLPTEAEWEVAARAGRGHYPWGNQQPICSPGSPYGAKFDDESACNDTDTEPVGSYRPNDYQLYDMAGNVMEWTADWYDAYPGSTVSSDEYGQTFRVARGGSWYTYGNAIRTNVRFPVLPASSFNDYGIRCASEPFESHADLLVNPQAADAAGSEKVSENWRPVIQNSSLLSSVCHMMYETHNRYRRGDIHLDRALEEFDVERFYLSLAVKAYTTATATTGDAALYLLLLEDRSITLAEWLGPGMQEEIGSPSAIEAIRVTCSMIDELQNEIFPASLEAGLSQADLDTIDLEMVPLISDLYQAILGGE